MPYNMNNFSNPQNPSNNLWVGNNYSNGGYRDMPTGYNNLSPQQPPMQQPQRMNNIIQVMGPESAQAYQIGPDSKVILMESNRPIFYEKHSDSSGYSEIKAFKFQEIPFMQSDTNHLDTEEYVTKNEFNEFKTMIEDLVMKHE